MILGTKVRIFIRFRLVAAYFYSFTPLSQSSEVGYIPVLAYLCLRPCLSVPASVLTRARARARRHACFQGSFSVAVRCVQFGHKPDIFKKIF